MLYEVFVYDPEAQEVVYREFIAAKSEASAERKAAINANLDGDPDDYDFLARTIGKVRGPKKVQEVKVVD